MFADQNNMRAFYNGLKAIWGPRTNYASRLKSADGSSYISEKNDILKRWAEHFERLLNIQSGISAQTLDRIRYISPINSLDDAPDMNEIDEAVESLRDRKAPGSDGLPGELFRYGGCEIRSELWNLICRAWRDGVIPTEWKDANMISIYKKGDRSECGNYRGISLLSIAGKVLARVILNRLTQHVTDSIIPETQCGFRSGKGTVDMIFSLKQVQEKCQEQNKPLYAVFVDFTKAFDTVSREGLWEVLRRCGCTSHFVTMIKAFHVDMTARVCIEKEFSRPFKVNNGVKQGCVMAPTLFSIYLSAVLEDAFRDCPNGVYIRSRPGANLFNVSQFRAKTKTNQVLIRELLFADDTALVAHTLEDIQRITTLFAKSVSDFGLQINLKKTEVLFQPPPNTDCTPGEVHIDGIKLANVDRFTYLGCTVTKDSKLDAEIQSRMAKASSSFGRLTERLWKNRNVPIRVKCKVYRAVVVSTLLYGSETWTVYRKQVKKLSVFMMRNLRSIMNVKWYQRISNAEILKRAHLPSMEEMLIQRNLRWAGHIARQNNKQIPRQILFSELSEGKRNIGRPKLRFKDVMKRNLKRIGIPTNSWQSLAQDRVEWRRSIHRSVIVA